MNRIDSAVRELNQILEQQFNIYSTHQEIHFEWLKSVNFQLDCFDDVSQENIDMQRPRTNSMCERQIEILENYEHNINKVPEESILVPNNDIIAFDKVDEFEQQQYNTYSPTSPPIQFNRSMTSPFLTLSPNSPKIRFLDDDSLLTESNSSISSNSEADTSTSPIKFSVSNSLQELTQSASIFRAQWQEDVEKKNELRSQTIHIPFSFDFEDDDIPETYPITDDDQEYDEFDREEVYESDPIEIHGKVIPIWARETQVLDHLMKQQKINPDSVFNSRRSKTCNLSEIFGRTYNENQAQHTHYHGDASLLGQITSC